MGSGQAVRLQFNILIYYPFEIIVPIWDKLNGNLVGFLSRLGDGAYMTNDLNNLSHEERSIFLDGLALLSQIFWGPDIDFCGQIKNPEFPGELTDFSALLEGESAGAVKTILAYIGQYTESQPLCQALEAAYVRLFISAPGGVAAPLYHSFYESEQGLLMGRPAGMMSVRLESAGLSLEDRGSEPPDHLAVEVEYLFFILETAWAGPSSRLETEARAFAAEELQPFAKAISKRLKAETDCPFYPAAAELLVDAVGLITG